MGSNFTQINQQKKHYVNYNQSMIVDSKLKKVKYFSVYQNQYYSQIYINNLALKFYWSQLTIIKFSNQF